MLRLNNYPELLKWYRDVQSISVNQDDSLLCCTEAYCRILDGGKVITLARLLEPLMTLVSCSMSPCDDLIDLYSFLGGMGFNLEDAIVNQAEAAALSKSTTSYYALSKLARVTNYPPLQFLAGWLALNLGMHKCCIEDCNRILEPDAQVLTLKGQAQLELGDATDAVKTFQLALHKSNLNQLAWFFLAKAFMVQSNYNMAWDALISCRKLRPESDEIPPFMALVALSETPSDNSKLSASWEALTHNTKFDHANLDFTICLLNLCFAANRLDWIEWITDHCDLNGFLTPQGIKELPKILRELQSREWHQPRKKFMLALELTVST